MELYFVHFFSLLKVGLFLTGIDLPGEEESTHILPLALSRRGAWGAIFHDDAEKYYRYKEIHIKCYSNLDTCSNLKYSNIIITKPCMSLRILKLYIIQNFKNNISQLRQIINQD